MSQATIYETLSIPGGASLSDLENALSKNIQAKIQYSGHNEQTAFDNAKKEVQSLLNDLFASTNALITAYNGKPKSVAEPQEIVKLREQSMSMLEDIQNNLIQYTICMLQANFHVSNIEEEIKKEEALIKSVSASRKVEWTSDIDLSLRKRKKRKRIIDKQDERLGKGLVALEAAYRSYQDFSDALDEIATGDDRERLSRGYTSALRLSKFPKAEKAVREVQTYKKKFSFKNAPEQTRRKASSAGQQYIQAIMKNQRDIVNDEGKLYIFPQEIRAALDANVQEVINIKKYIAKYHLPYMRGKLASLNRMRGKLEAMVTLERFICLYFALVRGLSEMMVNFQDIREYESNTVERAQYLVENQFAAIPVISEDIEKLIEIFKHDLDLYHNEFKPEDFTGDFDDVPDDLYI